MLRLTASRLVLERDAVDLVPAGTLVDAVRAHLRGDGQLTPSGGREPAASGLVVLGGFGSGKTHLCGAVATESDDGPPTTVVPLRDVARHGSIEDGLKKVVGGCRLGEARDGRRVLLLDGLDEVVPPPPQGYPAYFEELTSLAGPRWVLTSRPGHFRTDAADPVPDQVDVLRRADVATLAIDPLPFDLVRDALASWPGGSQLLQSVEGLEQLTTSPLLLHVVEAALPFIEPGRPIQPWGVFDAWLRFALSTGPGHQDALAALEDLAWTTFRGRSFSMEVPTWSADEVAGVDPSLRRALLVHDLDGRLRFGHRSVYEFLVASRVAPKIAANQDQPPDELSGVPITEAVRVFLVGRTGAMPVEFRGDRVRIPAGNFVSGGENSADERPLRILHLARPFVIAREPVTNADWARYLDAVPDDRIDANYLRHWTLNRRPPAGQDDVPVYWIWPEDADRYARWAGARLPSADEWEKAVRGLDGRRWPWGDFFQPGRAVTSELGVERPLPARAFGASGDAGLYSAAGGVFEYTSTPWRGRADRGRVVMGGCYTHPSSVSRASLRLSHKLSGHLKAGLRLAWDE